LRDRLRPGGAEARPSAADEIAKLEQLRAAGAIDEAEFIRAKQLALG
jgi:Short C-terminal domain